MNNALSAIKTLIGHTNNGKLLVARVPCELREAIPGLLDAGLLRRATFMYSGDAIRLP